MAKKRSTATRRRPVQRKSRAKYTIMARPKTRSLAGVGGSNTVTFIVLAIVTLGIYVLWREWKAAKAAGTGMYANAGNTAAAQNPTAQLPTAQQPTAQLPPAQQPTAVFTPKEVNNAFFQANTYAYADIDNLNIRETPGENGKVMATAKKGQFLGRHTGKSSDIGWPTSPGTWAKITLTDGRIGWAYSGYLKSLPVNTSASTTATTAKTQTGITPAPAKPALKGIDKCVHVLS